MQVLLIKDVQNLGKAGEVKEVKDGYAQNFLIAKGLAKQATNEVLNKYKAEQKKKAELEALAIAEAKQMQKAIAELELKIPKKIGANKHLFGSLTKEEIIQALQEQHRIIIDKKSIEIPQIKTLGKFECNVKLGHGIHTTLRLEVIAQN